MRVIIPEPLLLQPLKGIIRICCDELPVLAAVVLLPASSATAGVTITANPRQPRSSLYPRI
jgi:hypothetical protein